jgi:hypothetical protein
MAVVYTSTKIEKGLLTDLKKFCKKPRRGKKSIIIAEWLSNAVREELERQKLAENEKV